MIEPVGALPVIIEDDALIGGNTGIYEGAIVKVRITPAKDAHGLINGVLSVHSNRQSGSVMVIATVR